MIDAFPLGIIEGKTAQQLQELCHKLMAQLENTSRIRKAYYKTTGNIEYKEYAVSEAKTIIDDIDRVLANHYGFTDEELDFIINYDFKYRMGRESSDEDESEL